MHDKTFRAFARTLAVLLALLVGFAAASPALAEEGGYPNANVNVHDQASLQRGARIFMNYCVGCHSLKYMRYSQMAEGLGLTEKQVMDNLNFTGVKFGDPIVSAMPEADAEKWLGKAPPDLSLEVGAKGADWVAAYLESFYLDPATASGWNNTVFPNVAMPFPLWQLQGEQVAVMNPAEKGQPATVKELKLAHPGSMTPEQYDRAVRDLTAFLTYVSSPDELVRSTMGAWVVLYLLFFTLFALVLKKEYWKDVH
ncbi:MAG TPA: cytochrome c1 [Rhodanobacteraceae bacterium]|nr:cytochrome c1 [Rhodanobacteraceae bacterium]